MSRLIATFALGVAALLCTMPASGADTPSQSEVVALLSARDYVELDRRFTAVQADYKLGVIDDVELREAFRSLYFTTPSLASHFDEWVTRFPQSYVAHLARGIYHKKIGQESRGPQAAAYTSAQQFKAMEQAFERASVDFEKSMTLDEKPLLSFLHQINIFKLLGEGKAAVSRELLDRSVQLDQHNYVVRYAYMDALQSPWGGSVELMKAFFEECRQARLTADQLDSLEELVATDEAWTRD